MNRKISKMFLVYICYAVFFCSNTAFGIDWEQWRIPDNSSIPDVPAPVPAHPSNDIERPAPRQKKKDTRKAEASNLNRKGCQAYRAGNWKEAIDYYKKALRKSPNDRVIRQNLTVAQNALAEENAYIKLRKKNAQKLEAFNLNEKKEAFKLNKKKGSQAYRAGNWKEAVDYYEKALRRFPDDRGIRKNLTKAKNAIAKEQMSGNVQAANQGDAIKDLRNSVYWSLKAAGAISNNDHEAASEFADFPNREGGDVQFPSVPDVPSPAFADPQVRLYQFLIKEVNQTTSELKVIDTNLKQAKEEKRKSEGKIEFQKIKIKELKQKKSERKKENNQEEIDALIAAAQAAEDEAIEEVKEAEKNLVSLNEQKKEKEENLNNLQQGFDTAEEHPEQAGKVLKNLEGCKQ